MKWLGQYIQSFTARFRDDVYIENIGTSTETDMVVVNSAGLLSKRAIDAITVDVSDFMTNGTDNYILTATGTDAINAEANLQFDGTTLSQIGGDYTLYDTGNDGNPSISLGSSSANDFEIQTVYNSGAATLDYVNFKSTSASGTTNDGRFLFDVDGNSILTLLDKKAQVAGALGITQDSAGDATPVAALTVTNQDTDQIALDINAGNTTADVLSISAPALTTGNGIAIDIDDNYGASAQRSLIKVDYDKEAVTGQEEALYTTGLNVNMADTVTNHGDSIVSMIGAQIDIDSESADGTITQKGLVLNVARDSVGDTATTSGIEIAVMDGGTDIKMVSSADTGDYCAITTTTHGATTITTVDDDSHAADLTFSVDGFTKFTSPDTTGGGVEIENGSSSGAKALLIDNNDVDKNALYIEAANTTGDVVSLASLALTTGNAININCDSLTTGAAIGIDVDDATTGSDERSLISLDYDKAGVTGDGEDAVTWGLNITMNDNATNHSGSGFTMIGARIDVDSASTTGDNVNYGLAIKAIDATDNFGIDLEVEDGGKDITMKSSAIAGDYCTIATTANGATTIETVDASHALAHFEIAADGDITLDSAGQIKLEPVAGNNILLDGTIAVDAGVITGATSITSTAFVGDVSGSSGSCTGNAATATTAGTVTAAAQPAIESIGTAGDTLAILASDVNFSSATSTKPIVTITNTTNNANPPNLVLEKLRADNGVASGTALGNIAFTGEDNAQNHQTYANIIGKIDVSTDGEESGILTLSVANDDGDPGDGLILTGGSENNEIDVTVGLGANSVVTIPGQLLAHNGGMGTRHYGSTIKILPSDFIANDEGSIGVAFDDDANTGMVLEDTNSEMWAFVAIPEGMTATAVNIYSNNTARDYFVYEMDIDANGLGSSLGDAKLNTAITGLDVDSTATNFLAIKLDLSATNQRIRGGLVTIAPQ